MLVFDVDGYSFVRRECSEFSLNEDGTIHSKWSPTMGITVETLLIPTADGHIRKHIVNSDIECMAYDCGFAVSEGEDYDIEGAGEVVTIQCAPNTNLLNPYSEMKAVKYKISAGVTEIETKVIYPGL